MHPIADVAATLGSRFNVIFDPQALCAYLNVSGPFRDLPIDLAIGFQDENGNKRCLPFSKTCEAFEYVEQESTATTLTYRGIAPKQGLQVEMRILMPFYPQRTRLSTAPCYLVTVTLSRLAKFRWEQPASQPGKAALFVKLQAENLEVHEPEATQEDRDLVYTFLSRAPRTHSGPDADETMQMFQITHRIRPLSDLAVRTPRGFELDVHLNAQTAATVEFLWSGWTEKPLFELNGKSCRLKSATLSDSEDDLFKWFIKNRDGIEKLCGQFDALFTDWSLGRAASNLTALAFHSFLANTWWCVRPNGKDWFSVWEGSCYFHSTIDVEYNNAMLYIALWPELLDLLLDEWAEFSQPGESVLGKEGAKSLFLCHDMGIFNWAGSQAYDHHMPVEENLNYLLLLATRYAMGAPEKWVRQKLPLCRALAEFVVRCDSNGNGFPDKGTANTIDDASPAIQFGKEQTYLAVKAQAALWALSEVESDLETDKDKSSAERWKAFVAKSVVTLDEQAWGEDHYYPTLTRTTDGLVDPWTKAPLPEGELEGWDAYSIYGANGLLYLFLGGFKLPRWKLDRFRTDTEHAMAATLGPYGCAHTSSGTPIVWISQNIWRDLVAAYLELDLLPNIERYWDYQVLTGANYESSLYYDTTPHNNLNFYPRGAVIFGLPLAAAGLRMDLRAKEITLKPVRPTLSVPLLPFADWKEARVPWLHVRKKSGAVLARLTEPDLLAGFKIRVEGAELETV